MIVKNLSHGFIYISKFVIDEIIRIHTDDDRCIYQLNCDTISNGDFTVYIESTDYENRNIKKKIEENCSFSTFESYNNKKINELLYNYIKDNAKDSNVVMKSKPGFHYENGEWIFVSSNNGQLYCGIKADFETFSDKYSFEYSFCKLFLERYCKQMKDSFFLSLLRLCALLRTPLSSIGYKFEKIPVIYNCKTDDMRKLLQAHLKIYNRNDDGNIISSLDNKINSIEDIIYQNKDNVVIFEDASSSPYKSKKNISTFSSIIDKLNPNSDDKRTADCMIAVISDRFMDIERISDERCLFVDMNEIAKKDINAVKDLNYKFDQILVDIISRNFKTKVNSPCLEPFVTYRREEFNSDSSYETYKTMAVCVSILKWLCEEYDCEVFSDDDYIIMCGNIFNRINWSENVMGDSAIDNIKSALNRVLQDDGYRLVDKEQADAEDDGDGGKDVIYVTKDMILLTSPQLDDVRKQVPQFLWDKEGNEFKIFLKDNSFLVQNNGDKIVYKTAIPGQIGRRNFYAFKIKYLDDDSRSKLPDFKAKPEPIIDNTDGTDRVLLGVNENGAFVYWSIGKNLQNRHMFIQGATGSGKTVLLLAIAMELHKLGKKVIIFDFKEHSGYTQAELEKVFAREVIDEHFRMIEEDKPDLMYITDNTDRLIRIIRTGAKEAEKLIEEYMADCIKNNGVAEIFFIIDETKYVDLTGESAVGKALLDGRKHGISIITAMQVLTGKGAYSKWQFLDQSAVKIALTLDNRSAIKVAKSIDRNDEKLADRIIKFNPGEAIVYGQLESPDGRLTKNRYEMIKIFCKDSLLCPPE